MRIARPWYLFILLAAILTQSSGCATLPNVSHVIDEVPIARQPRQMVSSQGQLSPRKSRAVMERVKRSVEPTDVLSRHTAVVESVTTTPLTKGNRVTLLADGQATYRAMFKVIRHARESINLESYIIEDDETGRLFATLLLQKQGEGVQVNLIYDCMGSLNTPDSFFRRLRDAGIQVVGFNPINLLAPREDWNLSRRDHRKILIVDGNVAIIGGINISKVYSSSPFKGKPKESGAVHWRDTDIQIEGPAVAEFQKLFHTTWLQQKGAELSGRNYFPVIKEAGTALVRVVGSTPGESNRIPFIVYVSAISFAEYSIHLTNSYFIPDEQILQALVEAAERGVDVKIILPGITDSALVLHAQRYHYARLLKSGVKIYEHRTSLLHAKTAVVDSIWSTIGSTNLDFLSLLNNDEVNAVILNHDFAVEMETMFTRDLLASRQITCDEWEKRALLPRFREWFINIFKRLF